MRTIRVALIPTLLVAILFVFAGGQVSYGATRQSAVKPLVKVAQNATLGQILVNGSGFTLYHLLREDTGKSVCAKKSACLSLWPPLLLPKGQKHLKSAQKGAGISDKLGVAKAAHNRLQITYDGWRLYRYSGDSTAGSTNGNGLRDAYGKWWAVPNQPMVKLTINITPHGSTAWGMVTGSYSYNAHVIKLSSCNKPTCVAKVHAATTVHLTETPVASATWPWSNWTVKAVNAGGSTRSSTATRINVTARDAYRVSATYTYSGYK